MYTRLRLLLACAFAFLCAADPAVTNANTLIVRAEQRNHSNHIAAFDYVGDWTFWATNITRTPMLYAGRTGTQGNWLGELAGGIQIDPEDLDAMDYMIDANVYGPAGPIRLMLVNEVGGLKDGPQWFYLEQEFVWNRGDFAVAWFNRATIGDAAKTISTGPAVGHTIGPLRFMAWPWVSNAGDRGLFFQGKLTVPY